MEYDPKDIDVLHLLKKLKDSNGVYPQEMLVSRRLGYLKQVAEISGAAGLAMGLKNTVKSGGAGSAPAAGTLVEALLVVAILAEAGAVAYFYRDKVADFFQSISNSPQVELVTEAPVAASPVPGLDFTATSFITVTGTSTETATPAGTPTLVFAAEATQQDNGEGSGGTTNSTVSTPDPNNNNTNNGNQYGLTPKPERTREPGNDNSQDNQETNPSDSNDRRKNR